MVSNITNSLFKVKDLYTNFTNNYSGSLGDMKQYVSQFYTSKIIIFLIVGIIVSFIFFNILSFLFRTPFIIVVGLAIGYGMYKMYLTNEMNTPINNVETYNNMYY